MSPSDRSTDTEGPCRRWPSPRWAGRAWRAAAAVIVASAVSAPAVAVAQGDEPSTAAGSGPHVVDVEVDARTTLGSLAGGDTEAAVIITLGNSGTNRRLDQVAVVTVDGASRFAPPVDLRPGEQRTVAVPVVLTGSPGQRHEIVVELAASTATADHRTVPWILVGLGAIVVNTVLLRARDALRLLVAASAQRNARRAEEPPASAAVSELRRSQRRSAGRAVIDRAQAATSERSAGRAVIDRAQATTSERSAGRAVADRSKLRSLADR